MFTGIIEETGTIKKITAAIDGARIEVAARTVLDGTQPGDSIAVNGVCLTVVEKTCDSFSADLSAETLRRTSLRQMRNGTRVNLERALMLSSRLGGHLVQGHIDNTGEILDLRPEGEGWIVQVGFPPELGCYLVEKGSVTVDGISLTVAKLGDTWFEIAVIPQTWKVTSLASLKRSDLVNLETDIIARYVERLLQPRTQPAQNALTLEKMQELGY